MKDKRACKTLRLLISTLQNIAVVDFNVEMKLRNSLQALLSFIGTPGDRPRPGAPGGGFRTRAHGQPDEANGVRPSESGVGKRLPGCRVPPGGERHAVAERSP